MSRINAVELCVLLMLTLLVATITADTPPCPKPYHGDCALRGRTVHRFNHQYPNTTSAYDCSRLCLQGECGMFSFNTVTNMCKSFDITLRRDVYLHKFTPNESANTVFYNYNCFDCRYPCPTPHGVNLLGNGGFETPFQTMPGSISPWNPNGIPNTTHLTSPGFNSSAAAQSINSILQIEQYFKFCLLQLYDVSFDFRILRGNNKNLSYYLETQAGDMDSRGFIPPAVSGSAWIPWRTTTVGTYGTSEQFFLTLQSLLDQNNEGQDTYEIDNIVLTPSTTSMTPPPNATELMINGNFEKDTTKPFNVSFPYASTGKLSDISVISPGYGGSKFALQFFPPNNNAQGTYSTYQLSQVLPFKPGQSYVFSFVFLLRNETYKKSPYQCALDIYAPQTFPVAIVPQGPVVGVTQTEYISPVVYTNQTNVWLPVTRVLKGLYSAGTNGTMVAVTFRVANGCPLLVDNISLKEVP